MTRHSEITLALAGVLLCLGSVASANIPDPRLSTMDPAGVGDGTGAPVGGSSPGFHVTVHSVNNEPVLNVTIQLQFAGTAVRAYSAQNSGITVDVADQELRTVAPTGSAVIAARTGGFTEGAQVSGNGVVLGIVEWRSTDIDGRDGQTGLGDLSYFAGTYLARTNAPECNFNRSASNVPDLDDFTIFAGEYLSGATGTYAW